MSKTSRREKTYSNQKKVIDDGKRPKQHLKQQIFDDLSEGRRR